MFKVSFIFLSVDLRKKPQEDEAKDELKDKIDEGEGEGSKKKNRCFICKKKVGLTGGDLDVLCDGELLCARAIPLMSLWR